MTTQELDTLRPLRYCQSCCYPIGDTWSGRQTFPCHNPKCAFYGVVQTGRKHAAVIKDEWQRKHSGCTRINGSVIRDGMIRSIY